MNNTPSNTTTTADTTTTPTTAASIKPLSLHIAEFSFPHSNTIITALLSINCCLRCILRFIGVQNEFIYLSTDEILNHYFISKGYNITTNTSNTDSNPVCSACLGLFQYLSTDYINSIQTAINTTDYIFTDYMLIMSIPTSLSLRQKSIESYLKSILIDNTAAINRLLNIIECKELNKSILTSKLNQYYSSSNKSIKPSSDMELHLNYLKRSTVIEYEFMKSINQQWGHKINHNKSQQHSNNNPAAKKHRIDVLSGLTLSVLIPYINQQQWLTLFNQLISNNNSNNSPNISYESGDADARIPIRLTIEFNRQPQLVSGYYCKLYRDLSQTAWFANDNTNSNNNNDSTNSNTDRITDSSVEEQIVHHILPSFGAERFNFVSSGREDSDVRMLGTGRIFFIEIFQAKSIGNDPTVFKQMESNINAESEYVQIHSLSLSNKKLFNQMKSSIESKRKTYRCIIYTSRPITAVELESALITKQSFPITIEQQTPIRVLHRRSLLTRNKIIYSMSVEWINPHWFLLDLLTSSGTYIKEFVHSDRGRTNPSIAQLLNSQTNIIQLDVTGLLD